MNNNKVPVDELLRFIGENLGTIIHPVGSVYISEKPDDPANLFGGTWEQIKDTFILAAGNNYKAGETGGEATHSHNLTSATHARIIGTGTNLYEQYISVNEKWDISVGFDMPTQKHPSETTNYAVPVKGGTEKTNTLPPYKVMYVWKRVA